MKMARCRGEQKKKKKKVKENENFQKSETENWRKHKIPRCNQKLICRKRKVAKFPLPVITSSGRFYKFEVQ